VVCFLKGGGGEGWCWWVLGKAQVLFYLFGVCGRGWDCGWDEVRGWSGKKGLPVQSQLSVNDGDA